jgi:predicted SAM-dependent methyltransferase
MGVASYLKARLYDLGLDDDGRAELAGFSRGLVAAGVELVGAKLRAPVKGRSEYLHIGCGVERLPGFVNVDRVRTPATDAIVDMRHPLPFATGSFRGVFHQHAFEHIDYPKGARMLLRESARVLASGGILRMGVPDLARYVDAYLRGDAAFATLIGVPNCEHRAQIINQAFRHGHRFLYDFEALEFELARAGFRSARRASFRDSADPMLNQDRDEPSRHAETLFVEAIKSAD